MNLNHKFHNKLCILFVLRKNQTNKDRKAIIYCRITLNGVCTTANSGFSTGVKVTHDEWCAQSQTVLGESEYAVLCNEKLQRIKVDILAVLANYELLRKPITAKKLMQTYKLGGTNTMELDSNPTLVSLFIDFRDFLEDTENLGEDVSIRLEYNIRFMRAFTKHFYKNENVKIQEIIDEDFQRDIVFYCTKIRKFSPNYSIKRYEAILRTLDWAMQKGKIAHNPFATFRKPKKEKPKPIVYLSEQELEKLYHFKFFAESLQQTADCFLFSCYSGLACIDLLNLKSDQIHTDTEGKQWITGKRNKTRNGYLIPLMPRAQEILQKYGGKPENLPTKHNTIYNALLKQVGAMLDFKKKLTTHVARKTFAMHALNVWEIPLETVSRMLGHESITITQSTYAQINEQRIRKDTAKLFKPTSNIIQPSKLEISKFSTL